MNIAGNFKIVERGEPFTVREWREMAESRAFGVFLKRLDKMIESERLTCETCLDAEAWRRAQGALKVLKTVRALPAMIEGELANSSAGRKK